MALAEFRNGLCHVGVLLATQGGLIVESELLRQVGSSTHAVLGGAVKAQLLVEVIISLCDGIDGALNARHVVVLESDAKLVYRRKDVIGSRRARRILVVEDLLCRGVYIKGVAKAILDLASGLSRGYCCRCPPT